MPKIARFTLLWSAEQDLYLLYEHDHPLLEADSASWFTWLTTHTSFSFRGRNGHFNLLKEARKKSSEAYWYAYQRQGKCIAKRYVGRSIELSVTRLEEIGRAFQKIQILETSIWHGREEMLKEAVEQNLRAQDAEHAAALIDCYVTRRGFDDMQDLSTLRNWLEQLPDDLLSQYPLLCLHYAQVLSVSVEPEQPPVGILEQIETLLQMADSRWRAEGNLPRLGEVYAFRAYLAMRQGMQEQAVAYASQALRWLSFLESQHWRGVCLNLLGSRAVSCGQLTQATELLREALTIWTNLHHLHGARSCLLLLAMVYGEQGVLQHAAACYRRVIQEAREVGDREDLIPALLGLAQTLCMWRDVEMAEQVAQEAWDASEQWQNEELLQRSTSILLQIWSLGESKSLVRQRLTALQARFSAHPERFASLQPLLLQTLGLDREAPQYAITRLEPLSRQEQRVLRLLVAELSYAEIARELVVSINTVKTQVSSIYRKLNAHSRREARALAQDLRLFSTESHENAKNHERR
ncbi:hypothetical protein KSC_068970 [Ktedonobacter sp. SOSP1-52]|uniref:LuxR family transcriptional regulator n=1 Tax=Ktedonobacter sp. SOSP1-52 TaxID=2778366 RepID=UPI001A2575BF|nr:LuxR family transcriptional regulator [Ktedonobacter sp. SOSP1-52]GHO68005.1 hypothetical protein KSC_068970 [Ktedonobacter sp. SOSP1-52]